jgi:hypothetical protein
MVALLALLAGCNDASTGTYRAQVERSGDPPANVPTGYSLQDVQQKLSDNPRSIILKTGGRFETREGDRVIWEGAWRTEGDQLILRAHRVNGIDVQERLQDDKAYALRDGTIIDDSVYGAYNLRLVYRRQ